MAMSLSIKKQKKIMQGANTERRACSSTVYKKAANWIPFFLGTPVARVNSVHTAHAMRWLWYLQLALFTIISPSLARRITKNELHERQRAAAQEWSITGQKSPSVERRTVIGPRMKNFTFKNPRAQGTSYPNIRPLIV